MVEGHIVTNAFTANTQEYAYACNGVVACKDTLVVNTGRQVRGRQCHAHNTTVYVMVGNRQ